MIKYFAPNIPTTLTHELGHAIQNTNHTSSTHGLTTIRIQNGPQLEFNDMCVQVYKKIINAGLFDTFIEMCEENNE
jgi:hypothetical protein